MFHTPVLMHMADALLAPIVGIIMILVSVGAIAYSVYRIRRDNTLNDSKVPVMAVMAAFVFAAQMINFTIPGTGSSGHLCGGMMLAAVLGEFPAVLSLSAVLLIQCLFFADGGLMAIGCNIFNMGLCAIMVAYPLIYKPIMKKGFTKGRAFLASILACEVGLQLGAFMVVLETQVSGITALPFGTFVALMQPIHLAIGLVEGIITALVVIFIHETRPELLDTALENKAPAAGVSAKKVVVILAVAVVLIGGGLSLFASSNPDGLEWAIGNTTGSEELEPEEKYAAAAEAAGSLIEHTAFLPDYAFAGDEENPMGTTVSGLVGSAICVALAGGTAWVISAVKNKNKEMA